MFVSPKDISVNTFYDFQYLSYKAFTQTRFYETLLNFVEDIKLDCQKDEISREGGVARLGEAKVSVKHV